MTIITEAESSTNGGVRFEPETPFAEAAAESEAGEGAMGFMPWTESFSPFAETFESAGTIPGEHEMLIAEAFTQLRDETFDEALAELIGETSEAADQRLAGESPLQFTAEREQLAEAHLAPIEFEAEQSISRMSEGLVGLDLASLSPQQLDEVLDRFDPTPAGLSPAGEEFIGGLIRKAKRVVKTVVNVAGKVAKAAMPIIGPILQKLKKLIRPLLRRVLAIALNRLPPALHAPARALARRFGLGEAAEAVVAGSETESLTSPVAAGDPVSLAESLDAGLAESVLGGETLEEGESASEWFEETGEGGLQLEHLTLAREAFIQRVQGAADGEDLTPAVEQFIPAILPALRLGIGLVGRPKVVGFLAGYLAKLISQWVGPNLAKPLSNAIVDVGLRLVTLENGTAGELEQEAAPAVLAATVEDTVRRLAEQPEHLLEHEDLLQLAVGEAFEQAVAANFPTGLVRSDLQLAPTLGGSFVVRHARRPFAYKKFSRVPEVELTEPLAKALRTFGGVSLDAALRARGARLPMRFRVHIYESMVGTTLPRLARLERVAGLGAQRGSWSLLHPLTKRAASLLLREPRLGTRVPGQFLRSRHRIAVGQRFYYLEPIGKGAAPAPPGTVSAGMPMTARDRCATLPTEGRMKLDLTRSEAVVALYFSEADSLAVAASAAAGQSNALLRTLLAAFDAVNRSMGQADGAVSILKEQLEGEEQLAPAGKRLAPAVHALLRQKLREWASRALADWVRTRGQEIARAAQDPACGVTVTLRLSAVPGLAGIRQALNGPLPGTASAILSAGDLFRGAPTSTVTVTPGRALS